MHVEIRGLRKFYGEKKILDIERLEFRQGVISGVMGPNGAGKTTLLNIIAGIDYEYEGKIQYSGSAISQVRRKITMVFQSGGLLRRSVYDNIAYPMKIRGYGSAEIKIRVLELMDALDIHDLKDKKAHRLSAGETQKVALARALALRPSLLLLDEPTASIDPEFVKVMEKVIRDYNMEEGASVILITHSKEQSERICDDFVFIQNGKVVE